jgi:hypothetical protein
MKNLSEEFLNVLKYIFGKPKKARVRENPDSTSFMRYQIIYETEDRFPEGFNRSDDLASRVKGISKNYTLLYQTRELRHIVKETIKCFVPPKRYPLMTT